MPSNFSRRSHRKKQTRLAFDPVEPSSSATMSPARMRYEISSSPGKAFDLTSPERIPGNVENDLFQSGKKYAVVIETPKKQKKDGRLSFKPLVTSAESSQKQMRSVNSAGESHCSYLICCKLQPSNALSCNAQINCTSRLSRSKLTYSRITGFSGNDHSDSDLEIVPRFRRQRAHRLEKSSSPRKPSPLPTVGSSVSRPPIGTHKFISSNKNQRPMAYDGAEDDSSAGSSPEEEGKASGNTVRQAKPKNKSVTSRSITISDEESGVESPLESPTRVRMTHGQALLPRYESPANTDEPESADMRKLISGGTVNFSQKTKRTPRKRNAKQAGSISKSSSRKGRLKTEDSASRSDEEDDIAVLPTPQRTEAHGTRKKQIIITDDSEDLDVETSSSQRRSGRFLNSIDEDVSEDQLPSLSQIKYFPSRKGIVAHNLEDDEEEDILVVRSSARRRLRKRVEEDNEDHAPDDDDEDPISSPLKRRRMMAEGDSESDPFTSPSKRFRPGPIGQKGVESKAKENTMRITRQQQRNKPHRTAREKKLELLRRQRAGEKIIQLSSSESDTDEPRQGIYDSNSDLEVLSEFEDEEKDEAEGIEEVRRSLISSNQNDNDDEFIVDDDDVPLGVPDHGLNEIPLEFTHHAHKPLKEHFKDAVEWMIQNKVSGTHEDLYSYLRANRSIQRSIAKTQSMFKLSESLTWKFKVTLLQYIAQPFGRKPSPALSGLAQCS